MIMCEYITSNISLMSDILLTHSFKRVFGVGLGDVKFTFRNLFNFKPFFFVFSNTKFKYFKNIF